MADNNSSVYNSSSGYTNNNSSNHSNHSSSTFFISSNHAATPGNRTSSATPANPSSARKSTTTATAATGALRNSENYDKSTSLSSLLHQQHTTPLALPPPSSSPAKRSSLMSITSRSSGRDGITQQHPRRRVSFDPVSGGVTGRSSMTSVGMGRAGRSSSNYYSSNSTASSTDRRYDNSNRCIACWNGGVRWFQNCIDHDVPAVKYRRKLFKKYLRCQVWKIVMICFTIVLLFGSQIRDLFVLPIVMDTLFDVLFIVCFLFFIIDIIMRIDTENNYFDLFGVCAFYKRKLNRRRRHRQQQQLLLQQQRGGQNQQQLSSDENDYSSSHHRATSSTNHVSMNHTTTSSWTTYFNWGSFLFWCDLVSTLSLLYEISWINPNYFREATYDIHVDTNGVPMNGRLDMQGTGNPIQVYEIVLYIAICKAARMARFIRSSTVVRLSSKINWYFFINNLFNPIFYYKFLKKCCTYGPKYAIKYTYQQYNNVDTYNGHRIPTNSNRIRNTGTLLVNDNDYDDISERTDTSENVALATSISKITNNASIDSFHTGSLYEGSSDNIASNSIRTNQLAHSSSSSTKVGTAMRELTSQRVALSILIGLVLTVAFTYTEDDATKPSTMIVLHSQTSVPQYVNKALTAARISSIPDLFSYQLSNGTTIYFDDLNSDDPIPDHLRPREVLTISISDIMTGGTITVGNFKNRAQRRKEAWVSLLYTLFIVLVWVFGVTAFAGPVMVLVVIPIERMVRLLAMLMVDPLGYQSTRNYKRFVSEGDNITRNTKWSKDVLKGMETSFLMSTILRIGNLMKVGFGSAGVEIIRQNLEKSQSNNMSLLNSQGSIVSCIFLFCDIRNFTDATESLQEEVFVFTNSVAAVVHSHCASLGGSANKNVGDAFLLSWLLDEVGDDQDDIFYDDGGQGGSSENFTARKNQADKCLLAVVRICMALRLDDYYLSALSHGAREALITKLQNRPGSIVQMGCGLHAGKAVQGAIGSQRKIDATYVSEAVERAEFLESSTKKYGVNMLMSGSFHRLLDQRNKRRCRKVDQILFHDEENEDDEEENGQVMDMLTFDMDIDALGYESMADNGHSESEGTNEVDVRFLAATAAKLKKKSTSARKLLHRDNNNLEDFSETDASGGGLQAGAVGTAAKVVNNEATYNNMGGKKHNIKLVLPSGPAMYNPNVWVSEEMKLIRQRYSDGIFFQKFNAGLQSFYSKDWDDAKQCFQTILSRFEDGPSRYFLTQIEKNNGKPPRDFLGYGTAY